MGIEKTIVRVIVTTPDMTAKVQRLHDYGVWFELKEEKMTDRNKIEDFISELKARGGNEVKKWNYVDDDDLQPRSCVMYEYTK